MLGPLLLISALSLIRGDDNYTYYSTYEGTPITDDAYEQLEDEGLSSNCAIKIITCDENEGRRIDGTCNNLDYPTRGASSSPYRRMLDADYYNISEPRKAKSGNSLPLSRYARTWLTSEGHTSSPQFTHLVTNMMVYFFADVGFPQDTTNYVLNYPYCCEEEGKSEYMCVPNYIPNDDPVHRFSGERCINMTRPTSFQIYGCVPMDTTPVRLNPATSFLDLSVVYGNNYTRNYEKGRTFEGGLLKTEQSNGKDYPPAMTDNDTIKNNCLLNVPEDNEFWCFDSPDLGSNSLFGITLFAVWIWRHHNYIANELAELNSCWSDDQLFDTARDINIAYILQIIHYELFPSFMGYENMVNDGIISQENGFRDVYNSSLLPSISIEGPYASRWFHLMQEGVMKMYDADGIYVKSYPIVNATRKTGWLVLDDNIDEVTQGAFRQAAAKGDDLLIDPDIAEMGLGNMQHLLDITTNDHSKGRYFGIQPYIRYREFCTGSNYSSFEDLEDAIEFERIELLQAVYEDIEDVDLIAGLWLERPIDGGFVPPTVYCIVKDMLMHNIQSDRHWYERETRPKAFSTEQLQEIRKATVALLLCTVGDSVTEIQPKAFERPRKGNEIAACSETTQAIDFSVWKDSSCTDGDRK